MALLFQFGLRQRPAEVGTLLALGWTPRQVRRLLLGEGVILALMGGLLAGRCRRRLRQSHVVGINYGLAQCRRNLGPALLLPPA